MLFTFLQKISPRLSKESRVSFNSLKKKDKNIIVSLKKKIDVNMISMSYVVYVSNNISCIFKIMT